MKKKLFILSLLSLIFIFASCEKNDNDVNNSKPKNPEDLYAKTEYNLDMRDFAMAVNEAINTNKSFRKLVKEEALKKFDGDYDILLSRVVEKSVVHYDVENGIKTPNKVKQNLSVRNMLEDAFYLLNEKGKLQSDKVKQMFKPSGTRQNVATTSHAIIDELIDKYPNIQISVPIHVEDLEDENYVPPVTFVTMEAYRGETENLIAYKGEDVLTLDATTPPDYGVIVVGLNERVLLPEDPLNPNFPLEPIDMKPQAPSIEGFITESGIRLIWNVDNVDNIDYFEIYRIKAGVGTLKIATISASSMPYVYDDIKDLENKAIYTYYINSCNSYGETSSNPINIEAPQKPYSLKNFEAILQGKDEIELRWENYLSQYISYTKLERRFQGVNDNYFFYKSFSSNDSYYFDRDVKGGDRVYYRITHNNNTGESDGKYDFIYVPYRNILETSPIKLDSITYKWTDTHLKDDIEGWFQGYPEFQIKVLTVDSKGAAIVVFDEMIQAIQKGSVDCKGIKLHSWLPSNLRWYDVLTFKVIESDPDWGTLQIKVDAQVKAKIGTDSLGANVGLSTTYTSPEIKFNNGGDDMGDPVYYTYFDPINYILEFDNYNFKIYLK